MTSRMAKASRSTTKPTITLHCPSCRQPQRCRPIGTAVVDKTKTRREVVECQQPDCGLQWLPARTHLTALPTAS